MQKVKKGDPFSVSAGDWNKVVDLVNSRTEGLADPSARGADSRYVPVLNNTEHTIPDYGALVIKGVDGEGLAGSYPTEDYYIGEAPSETDNPHTTMYAVLQYETMPGEIGSACVEGLTLVKRASASSSAPYFRPYGYLGPTYAGNYEWAAADFRTKVRHIMPMPSVQNRPWLSLAHISPVLPDTAVPVEVVNAIGEGIYEVKAYYEGYASSKTVRGYAYLPDVIYGEYLPAGYRTVGHLLNSLTITGEWGTLPVTEE